jgi:hypothetical protein
MHLPNESSKTQAPFSTLSYLPLFHLALLGHDLFLDAVFINAILLAAFLVVIRSHD